MSTQVWTKQVRLTDSFQASLTRIDPRLAQQRFFKSDALADTQRTQSVTVQKDGRTLWFQQGGQRGRTKNLQFLRLASRNRQSWLQC